MRGLIVKGIGGFYYVNTPEGIFEAKGRGTIKKDGDILCVGDEVELSALAGEEGKGVIDKILPRKNMFRRPPIANIDLFIVTIAVSSPPPNYSIIDKFIVNARYHGIEPLICINKTDMASAEETDNIKKIYQPSCRVVAVSAVTGDGIEELSEVIKGQKAAFAGPSGVGKSSIVNRLHPSAFAETGEISCKTGRGRHTTRHVEIFKTERGGMIFDTPGFTSFEMPRIDEEELRNCYPEFAPYAGYCRYTDCSHISEPGCRVKEAVSVGEIHPLRYMAYEANVKELRNKRRYHV